MTEFISREEVLHLERKMEMLKKLNPNITLYELAEVLHLSVNKVKLLMDNSKKLANNKH